MTCKKHSFKFCVLILILWVSVISGNVNASECKSVTPAEFAKLSVGWKGRTLFATASWCATCKTKLLEAHGRPQDFVVLVAFDEASAMEKVLEKFSVTSPCVTGKELVEELKIDGLPWESKI